MQHTTKRTWAWVTALFFLLLAGCERPSADPTPVALAAVTPTLAPTTQPTATPQPPVTNLQSLTLPTATPQSPTPAPPTPTPFYTGALSPACGQILPILPAETADVETSLSPDAVALANLGAIMPAAAKPAWEYLLANPQNVGLAAFRAGDEANGVYLNADAPMPLASVVKIIHLVAYAEAVAAGELDPASYVPVAELEQYYQPGLDLGSHQQAIADLEGQGVIWGEPPQVRLSDIPWMMMRYSSNAAMDYLHLRLGQERIEATAVSLGLTTQTAPCTFLGQFLAMGNFTRSGSDYDAVNGFLADPAAYGQEAALLADAYVQSADFRETQTAWRRAERRPSMPVQRLFSDSLNPQGSAGEYAGLMARLAQNGLSNPDSSYLVRRYLEWPMVFEANQELFSNLGYKNGSMPGVLTTAYYAYPLGEVTPVVVVLFFRDLPNRTYQDWRRSLPHDELARWLLSEPAAIGALRGVFGGGE
ncbi:MAG: serine hydrolase [Chloroflexi bacterium]|nr:serine hydrolase [Chloroflexota bacterium]